MTVTGKLGSGWLDCQPLVTKHLPADRIAINLGNVVTVKKKKRDRGEPEWGRQEGQVLEGKNTKMGSVWWVDKEEGRCGGEAEKRCGDSGNGE